MSDFGEKRTLSPSPPPSAPYKSAPARKSIPHLCNGLTLTASLRSEGSRPLIYRCESEVIEREARRRTRRRAEARGKPKAREETPGPCKSAHSPHAVGDRAKGVKNLHVPSRCKPITGRDGSRHIAPATAQTLSGESHRVPPLCPPKPWRRRISFSRASATRMTCASSHRA